MNAFEFVFSLFGLVLGLSVTELLAGFSRAVRRRGKIRLGWLTPLLGVILLLDLLTFWLHAWEMRAQIPMSFGSLIFGTAIAGIYYLSASLVFPEDFGEWDDLDDYFMSIKKLVMLGVTAANWLMTAGIATLTGSPFNSVLNVAIPIGFTTLAILVALLKSRRWSVALAWVIFAAYLARLL
ncbi:MAG TPA: hypothetical protein VEW04_01765 [Allosphingosinicella sp.]|nr:hypothetical protein [Allosphingosinicella sp.]